MKRIRMSMAIGISLFFLVMSAFAFFSGLNMENALTGFVPRTVDDSEIQMTSRYDALVLRECQKQTTAVTDCFDIIKSFITVTSKGDPQYTESERIGLVPLDPTLFDENVELSNPDTNIALAVEYVMSLYTIYNKDLTLTTIAYYAGRAYTNELMYILQRNNDAFGDGVSYEQLVQALSAAERSLSNKHKDVQAPEEIQTFYDDVVGAYHFWADKPLRDISVDKTLFEYGTYALFPSFAVTLTYNFNDYNELDSLVHDFFAFSKTTYTEKLGDITVEQKRILSFFYFKQFLDAKKISYSSDARSVTINHFTIYDGDCNPVLEKYYRFVDDFKRCLNTPSYCSINPVTLPEEYAITIVADAQEYMTTFTLSLVDEDNTLVYQEVTKNTAITTQSVQRNGNLKDEDSIRITKPTSVILSGKHFVAVISQDQESRVNKEEYTEFTAPQTYQRFCAEREGTSVYNKLEKTYAPLQYHFAFMLEDPEPFDWYKTQSNAGLENCVPAIVAMSLGFSRNIDIPVDSIRHITGYDAKEGGATNLHELEDALDYYHVPYQHVTLDDLSELAALADDPNAVVIVPMTIGKISFNPDWKTSVQGRHHEYTGGHYVLLIDYINGSTEHLGGNSVVIPAEFEVYDPLSEEDQRVENGDYAGKGRLFKESEVYTAMEERTDVLVIHKE